MTATIGQQLKQAREAKNLTIQKVVQATHIRAYQIEAIEADDFESLPSPVQARAFLRLYTDFLRLSLDEVIARQRAGIEEIPAALADLTPAPIEPTAPITETGTVPAPLESPAINKGINGLARRIKRVFSHPREQSTPLEPAEKDILPKTTEPVEAEIEEPDAAVEANSSPDLEDRPSQAVFTAIGLTLRQRRESLSLTLDEIERHTHVRKHYLQALDAGEFDRLPSSVQARGMLNNYARFLDMDVDALLLKYAEGLQSQRLEKKPIFDETSRKPASKYPFKASLLSKLKLPAAIQRYLSVDILVGGGLVLVLLTFAIWGTNRIINLRAGSTPQPTAPSGLGILVQPLETITASPTQTTTINGTNPVIPVAGETLVLTLPAAGLGPVQVVLVAQEQAWVRVTVDGKIEFEGRVTAGNAYPFDGNKQIEVLTGNGRAISILYNQNNLGPMGNFGEVVDHIYTADAILNPTATFTPTPTISPTPTITLRPTLTLRPSTTPSPSATPRLSPTAGQ